MTTARPIDEAPARTILRHAADLMRLAWPVMLSRAGILVMAFVDIAMLGRGEGVFAFAFGTLGVGAAVLMVLGAPRLLATDWASLPWLVWLCLGYLVIFASFGSISLLQYGSMRLKAAKVMAYTYMTPTFVLLWELALTGRLPTAIVLPGIALTVVALLILLREGQVSPVPRPFGS